MAVISEKEYKRLKRMADEAKTESDRAQGQLDAAMATLKNEFGCSNMKQAEKVLEELNAEMEKAQEDYDKAKKKFEEEWSERLAND